MVDFHLVLDLVPTLAKLFFLKTTLPRGSINLSYAQAAILIGLGLQFKKVEDIEADLGLNSAQILPQFNKVIRKFTKVIKSVYTREIERKMDEESKANQQVAQSKINQVKAQAAGRADSDDEPDLVKQLDQDKKDFIKKAFKENKVPDIVSLPVGTLGKREAEEDVAGLESKSKKQNKKHKSR